MGSAATKNTLALFVGEQLKKEEEEVRNNAEGVFSITPAEILKLYGQASARIIINFQVIKQHKQERVVVVVEGGGAFNCQHIR